MSDESGYTSAHPATPEAQQPEAQFPQPWLDPTPESEPVFPAPGQVFDVHVPGGDAQRVKVMLDHELPLAPGDVAVEILSHARNGATIDPTTPEMSSPLVGKTIAMPASILRNAEYATLVTEPEAPGVV